jgi:hypothetical protein
MTWAYVENGSVVEEHSGLPRNWRNYSNFFALESDVRFLRSIGWYQLVDNTAPITNDFLEYHGEPEYAIDGEEGIVVRTRPILLKDNPPTAEELFAQSRNQFIQQLRDQRNQLLKDSDWTQMLDVQFYQSEEWINAWRVYRQNLRDLPELYESYPLSELIDCSLIQWPPVPVIS